MTNVRVVVLGALTVAGPAGTEPSIPARTEQLIALLVAAGSNGISKEHLAAQIWPGDLPQSWQSSLRNRVTQVRRLVGNDGLANRSGRYHLGPSVSVDSWDLLGAPLQDHPATDQQFGFLDGEPFVGIAATPLLISHQEQIVAARAARIQQIVADPDIRLAPFALQTLRTYQLRHALDSTTTQQTVLAHFQANDVARANEIIRLTQQTADQHEVSPRWIAELEGLSSAANQQTGRSNQAEADAPLPDPETEAIRLRAHIFASAAENDNWTLALEIATSGLPGAINVHGDPERLELLQAIPIDRLDSSEQFRLAHTLAQHLMLVQQETDARTWSLRARELSQTPDDELMAIYIGGIVGDTTDEREPLKLPDSFEQQADSSIRTRVLQMSAISHLERAPAAEAADLVTRVNRLVEESDDPHRRWQGLLLRSMLLFVAGDWARAATAAEHARDYGVLFSVTDAATTLRGQLLNPAWVHEDFGADDRSRTDTGSPIDEALYQTLGHDGDVDAFIDSLNCESRAFYTVPVLVLTAHKVTSPINKRRVAKRLQARSGTSAILGAGAMHYGPVDRSLAFLASDTDERDAHMAEAIRVADLQQTRVWQVLCRLEHSKRTKDPKLVAQAQALATTPELQLLVRKFD